MTYLRTVWELWKRFGLFLGNVIGRIFLTIFYFTIFLPFGLGVRLFADPLDIKGKGHDRWVNRQTGDQDFEDARRLV